MDIIEKAGYDELCNLKIKIGKLEQRLEDSALALEVARVAHQSWIASLLAVLLAAGALVKSFIK